MAAAGVLLSVCRQISPMHVVLAKGSFHLCVSTFLKYDIYFQIPEGKMAKRKSENDIPPKNLVWRSLDANQCHFRFA